MATPFKMKNSMLKKSAKTGSPIYKNYGAPMKDRKDPGLPDEGGNINWGTVDAAKAHNKKHNQGLGPDHKTKATTSAAKHKVTKEQFPDNYEAHNAAHADGTFKSSTDHSSTKTKRRSPAKQNELDEGRKRVGPGTENPDAGKFKKLLKPKTKDKAKKKNLIDSEGKDMTDPSYKWGPQKKTSPAKQTKKQQSQIDKEKEIKSKHYDMYGKKSLKEGSIEHGKLKKAIRGSRRQSVKDSKKKK